ncbi:MAG: FAD-binding oxidoreductase [Chloroflexi bacterium]|nr:FAD-binding oxidoreductase [Chloroflexota bacterium]
MFTPAIHPQRAPWSHWRLVENFGHSIRVPAQVFQPATVEQLADLFARARRENVAIALRGSGRSYGDAAMRQGHWVLDLRRMNRILAWDPKTGEITVEPGVTIEQLWRYVLPDGWWPAVVPGTMRPTMGGCVAMNVHGKNNWHAGTFGEHVTRLRVLTPAGDEYELTPDDPRFHTFVGGLGVLGVATSITLRLKRVASGNLDVHAWAVPDLAHMLADLDTYKDRYEYIVGWVDSTAMGWARGRGQIHAANHVPEGEELYPERTLSPDYQVLPDVFFGFVPKAWMWRFMRPFMTNWGVRLVNSAKYWASRWLSHHKTYRQALVAFNFLLDYIPNWERAYRGRGLIQYQIFVPRDEALRVFNEVLRYTQQRGMPSYLAVVKRHRADAFLLSHGVDGYSLALDFPVWPGKERDLVAMLHELDRLVLDAGGRFYFAKDATLTPDTAAAFLGEQALRTFFELKATWDPEDRLQTDLYRRVFAPLRSRLAA